MTTRKKELKKVKKTIENEMSMTYAHFSKTLLASYKDTNKEYKELVEEILQILENCLNEDNSEWINFHSMFLEWELRKLKKFW